MCWTILNKKYEYVFTFISFLNIVLSVWYKTKFGSQTLATNFGSHAQMITKFGGQILATKFVFVMLVLSFNT